jgi:hypothetical protein
LGGEEPANRVLERRGQEAGHDGDDEQECDERGNATTERNWRTWCASAPAKLRSIRCPPTRK